MSPALSIIIPSYNGAQRLPGVLQCLAQQQVQAGFEVIVLLDGSTDDSAAVVAELELPLVVRVHTQPNGGRGAARNAGARLAQAPLLLFLDDDMRPEPTVVQAHIDFHATHPGCVLVGGQHTPVPAKPSDFQQYLLWGEQQYTGILHHTLHEMPPEQLYITAAHCSLPAAVFWQVGGFDTRLTDLEDFALSHALRLAGVPIWRNESLVAWHESPWDSPQRFTRRQREYVLAKAALYALRPDIARHPGAAPIPTTPTGSKRLVYSLLARRFWVACIGKAPLSWLPKKLRFRLYSTIIFGLASYFRDRPLPTS